MEICAKHFNADTPDLCSVCLMAERQRMRECLDAVSRVLTKEGDPDHMKIGTALALIGDHNFVGGD